MKKFFCLMMIAAHVSACATYSAHTVSFRPPNEYRNFQNSYGILVGAESFADKKDAEKAFGFDARAAGVVPVQLVINNKSGQTVEIVSGQTFLIDRSNRYWKILTNREAVDRVKKAADAGIFSNSATKGATGSVAAGSLMGLAIEIVSGRKVDSTAVKGEAPGATAVGGAGKAGEEKLREARIAEDVRAKGIEGKIMPAESLASGFIFFPGEASSVSELRMQIKFRDSGRIQTLNLKLN
jgi:hypothetical protein